MQITDAIKRADDLLPNPYTDAEKYCWCDELGAMLKQEYNKTYSQITLTAEAGNVFLPSWLHEYNIEKVVISNREIKKQDMRSFGIRVFNTIGSKYAIQIPQTYTGDVVITYLDEYMPIRDIKYIDTPCTFGAGFFITAKPDFEEGDVLKITVGEQEFDDVCIFGVEIVDDGYKIIVADNTFNIVGERITTIERYVTEETVCPPPYDAMYIHFLHGKINYYQHDYAAYNQDMSLVNAKIDAYARWNKQRSPYDGNSKLEGWI